MKLRSFLAIIIAVFAISADAQSIGILPCASFTISVSGTSANQQLSKCGPAALLQNVTSQEVFFSFGGTSATTATTSGYSIPGNSYQLVDVGTNGQWIAAITASSSSTLRITQGIIR